jgi:hypothetical protein
MTDWQRMAHFCCGSPHLLSEREREFVDNACGWRGDPTEKQAKWLRDIHARLVRARSAAS